MNTPLLSLGCAWLVAVAGLWSAENHPPVIDPPAAQYLVEDQSPVVLTLTGIGSGDPAAGQTVTMSVTVDDPTLLSAALTYAGGGSAILVLSPLPDRSGATSVRITLHDDGGGSDTTLLGIPVAIAPVDDPPSVIVPATWTINENETDPARLRIICTGLRAGPDDEAGQTVTADVRCLNPDYLLIDPIEISAGTLTIPIQPIRDASGQAQILLRLSDGTNSRDYSILVTINFVPYPPSITVGPGVAVAPGGVVRLTRADFTVHTPDNIAATVTVRSVPTHGQLRFNGAALAVGSRFYMSESIALELDDSLTYHHDGSTGTTDAASFSCSDPYFPALSTPVTLSFLIGGRARPWVSLPAYSGWVEHDGPVLLFPTGDIVDPDSPSFAGGSLQVAIIDQAVDEIILDIANQGDGPGQVGRSGTEVRVGGVVVGSASPGHGVEPLVVTFTGAGATQAAALAVLRAVTFDVPLNTGISYPTVEVVADDGEDGRSPPATMKIYTSENLDELPLLPAGLRLATLAGLTREIRLGAYETDGSYSASPPVWSVSVQPANATITMLSTTTESGPLIRLVPTATGTGEAVFKVLDHWGRSALIHVPVLVLASIDEARPHPQAESPREVLAGDAVDVVVPWDARDVAVDAVLSFSSAGTAPDGLVLTVQGDRQVRVTWPVPSAAAAGTRYRFQILAEDPTHGVMGFLPFDVLVRARPGGGG